MSHMIIYLTTLAIGVSCLSLFDNSVWEVGACILTIYSSYSLGKIERQRW